jgi:hypothetical protein
MWIVHGKLELKFRDFRVFFTYVRWGSIGDNLDSWLVGDVNSVHNAFGS